MLLVKGLPAIFIRRTAVAGLLLAALLLYLPPYSDSFLGDDYVQLDRVSNLVTQPWLAYQVLNPFWDNWYYRPLQNLWFLANRLLFGFTAFPYYYLQICLHMLAMALIYRVARQLALTWFVALCSLLLFGFHGHHFDVVTWLSSIAIVAAAVFSLLTLSTFLTYLAHPEQKRFLAATVAFFLLSLLTHEAGFLLLPLLLFLWWLEQRRVRTGIEQAKLNKKRSRTAHVPRAGFPTLLAAFLAMFLATAVYVTIQFIRPNLNVSVSNRPAGYWLDAVDPNQISLFVVETAVRYLTLFNASSNLQANAYLVTGLIMVLLTIWFWQGNQVVRLGLVWLIFHLGFIYIVLWLQRPEFFAGRHLYIGLIGLVLALGASLEKFMAWPILAGQQIRRTAVVVVLALLLLIQANTLKRMQATWLTIAEQDKMVKRQMQQLLPELAAETHLFAYRFASHPSYLPATAMVWYDQPLARPAGSLAQLRSYGQATRHFYLFDYANGRLTNLMPELQEHELTLFLWSYVPWAEVVAEKGARMATLGNRYDQMVAAGPEGDQRLALLTPLPDLRAGWLSLLYEVTAPEGSTLHLAVRRPTGNPMSDQAGIAYRVLIEHSRSNREVLFAQMWTPGDTAVIAAGWEEVIIPMDEYWNQTVNLRLEVRAAVDLFEDGGYWANPRLVVD